MRRQSDLGIAGGMGSVTADYRVVRSSKMRSSMRGMAPAGAGADWEFRSEADYYRCLAMSRYVDQNDKIVGQGVTRAVNLIFKSGLKYDAATGDATLDGYIKKKWCAWSEDPRKCDAQGRSTLAELCKLAFRHVIVDGDHVVLPLKSRRLQCIEGHRLVTPYNARNRASAVHCGVRRDSVGRPTEYWITRQDQGPLGKVDLVSDVVKYPAYDRDGNPQVFHLFKPDRVSQTRGVTCFVRIIDNAMAHDDLQWAMLIKEQASACVTFFREQAEGVSAPTMGAAFGPITTETNADGTTTRVHELRPGLEIQGRPGEKFTAHAPNLPGDGFLKHSVQVLKFISVNLGIPVIVLLLDPSETNFSGWRGAMDIAKHGFEDIRGWMRTQFLSPVYRWWLADEIASEPYLQEAYARLGDAIYGHQFTAPYDPYIDPVADVTAEEKQLGARLDSRRNVLARRGLDLDEVDLDIVADQVTWLGLCADGARLLNKTYPEAAFSWRDVAQVGVVQGSPPSLESGDRSPEEKGSTTKDTKSTKKPAAPEKKGDKDA